jgi:hypothetical protein
MKTIFIILALVTLTGCEEISGEAAWKREAKEAWVAPCADTSWLLATTAGSPDHATCPNQKHRMRVQVATKSSNEEIGALVFCECPHNELTK